MSRTQTAALRWRDVTDSPAAATELTPAQRAFSDRPDGVRFLRVARASAARSAAAAVRVG